MSRRFIRSLAAVALLGLGGVGASVGVHAAARTQAAAPIKTTSARMLVNGQGMTLYVYAPDKKNKSVCYGQCAAFWPPLVLPKGAAVPSTAAGMAGTFGVTTRTDGKKQLTYNGAPLYTFIKDKKPGQMAGQGLDVAGGYWWVVVAPPAAASTTGSPSSTSSTPQATATPSSGGSGGYYGGNGGDDHNRNRGDRTTPTPDGYYGGGHGGHGADG